jgi:hypothetical protein
MFQPSAAALLALACTIVVAIWTARILFRQ